MAVNLMEYIDFEVIFMYVKCIVFLMVKMMLMSILTAFYRMKNKAFANPEDVGLHGKEEQTKKYVRTDPDVERIRRIHLNDLENIVPFAIIGLFYSITGVSYSTAWWHYQLFVWSRIFHTIAYFIPLPQPCRGLSWGIGYFVTFSMVYKLFLFSLQM